MTATEKKAVHKEAMVARKNLNLSQVANCMKAGNCDGSDLNSGSNLKKKQRVKSLSKEAGTVDLADGDAKFSFPNVITDTDVFVS